MIVKSVMKTQPIDQVLQALEGSDFSTIPLLLARILNVGADPNANAKDLADVCKQDLASSARMLKAANSIFFGRRMDQPKVASLTEAIVRIGFRHAREIILSATLAPIMVSHGSIMDYSASLLWKHSIAVAVGNRLIYDKVSNQCPPGDPYLVGLLHDMGIALEHQVLFNDGFSNAVHHRYINETELSDEERRFIGATHTEIGTAVAEKWNFPEYLVETIRCHHDMDPANPYAAMIHVNRISEWISYFLNLGYCDFSKYYAERLSESRHILDLSPTDIQSVSAKVKAEMEGFDKMGWFAGHSALAA